MAIVGNDAACGRRVVEGFVFSFLTELAPDARAADPGGILLALLSSACDERPPDRRRDNLVPFSSPSQSGGWAYGCTAPKGRAVSKCGLTG